MVAASVLGAATGTGLALFIAITLVMYRYYVIKRRSKEMAEAYDASNRHYMKAMAASSVYIPPRQDFSLQPEHLPIQPRSQQSSRSLVYLDGQGGPNPTQPPMTAHSFFPRRASVCSTDLSPRQIPRLVSVDEGRSLLAVTRRGSDSCRAPSPLICTTSPEGSSSQYLGAEFRIPLYRSSSVDARCPMSPFAADPPRSPTPFSPGPFSPTPPATPYPRPGSPRPGRPLSPLLLPKSPTSSDSSNFSPGAISPLDDDRVKPSLSPNKSSAQTRLRATATVFGFCNALKPKQASDQRPAGTTDKSPVHQQLPKETSSQPVNQTKRQVPSQKSQGAIQPDLYKTNDILVLETETSSGSPRFGRLHFRLKYDSDRSDLIVQVIEAHDLVQPELGGFNDPYVKVTLLPEVDARKRQTSIRRNSAHPFFNETFKFPVAQDELPDKVLLLQVFDYDKYSRNDVIGEVRLPMRDIELASEIEVWSEIKKNKKPPGENQELLFSLSYLPSAERLTVVILKARNLLTPNSTKDAPDPYVKVYLVNGNKRMKKKKTATKKQCANPVWNEAISFNVPADALPNMELELCVLNHDLLGNTPQIGSCFVGPRAEGTGQEHWNDMTQSMRKSVAMWHSLK